MKSIPESPNKKSRAQTKTVGDLKLVLALVICAALLLSLFHSKAIVNIGQSAAWSISSFTTTTSFQKNVETDSPKHFISNNKSLSEVPKENNCIELFACSPSSAYIVEYFFPYVPELLSLDYKRTYLEQLRSIPSGRSIFETCTKNVLVIPRPESSCFRTFHEVFAKAESMRENVSESRLVKNPWPNQWRNEIYWHSTAKLIPLENNRPLLVYVTGEVFDAHGPKPQYDVVLYRGKKDPVGRTLTGHFLQGIALSYSLAEGKRPAPQQGDYHHELLLVDPSKTDNYYLDILGAKRGFAAIMSEQVIKRGKHHIDASIRWAVCSMLHDYKSCHNIASVGTNLYRNHSLSRCRKVGQGYYLKGFSCYSPYKFAIVMENTLYSGYVSEKLFNAKLANTIPVYLGPDDVNDYFNLNSFVFCNISQASALKLRSYDDLRGVQIPNMFGKDTSSLVPTDEQIINFTKHMLYEELEPCVQQIILLDKNDTEYIKMLKAPLYKENRLSRTNVDGYSLASGFVEILEVLST